MAFPKFSGAGSPEGVQVGTVGDYYENETTGVLYQKATGVGTNTGWVGALEIAVAFNEAFADAQVAVPADGGNHLITPLLAAPPAWLDNAANIILPGLYECIYSINPTTPPTTPGSIGLILGQDNLLAMYNVDDFFTLNHGLVYVEMISVSAADLPFACSANVRAGTDATTVVSASYGLSRLLNPTP